jgi:hypothetical protein
LTDTPSAYSAGEILFQGPTEITSESTFFWDATNDRLGIGTATPSDTLEVEGAVVRDGFAQYVSSTAENSTTETAITFETKTREDASYYSQDPTTAPEEITVLQPGWYRISYSVSFWQNVNTQEVRRAWLETCGGAEIASTSSYCYMEGSNKGRNCTTATTVIKEATTANTCVELHTECAQGGCDSDLMANETWLTIEKF